MNTRIHLVVSAAILVLSVPARAEEGLTLNQARSQMNKGTWPGIAIFRSEPKAQPPAGAASAASAAASPKQADAAGSAAPAAKAAAVPAASPAAPSLFERIGALVGGGEPPSGRPLDGAKRLEATDQGMRLPAASARAASASAAR